MTLGEKIRKYRLLKGMTQKDLGLKVGFSSTTADSRIRKYESNLMAPKEDIRGRLVEVLEVDPSALSDIDIQSAEDIMQVLFFLEETCGMNIERTAEKTSLTFNNANKDIPLLISYFYAWHAQKQNLPDKDGDNNNEASASYEKWKARFPRDLRYYWEAQHDEIIKTYKPLISALESSRKKVTQINELLMQIRSMIQAGITVQSGQRTYGVGDGALLLTFKVAEMLKPDSPHTKDRFAEFLFDLKVMQQYGMITDAEMSTGEEGTMITYVLRHSPFMVLRPLIERIQLFEQQKDKNDYGIDMFESDYNDQIEQLNVRFVENMAK